MKYCQKCKAMLKDEIEICPICGYAQKSAEELEAAECRKQKTVSAVRSAAIALLAAAVVFIAVCMIFGKEPEVTAVNESYTAEVTDTELLTQFTAYVAAAIPTVWEESEENLDSYIEYYQNDNNPEMAAGLEQLKALRPVVGDVKSVQLKSAARAEDGGCRLVGEVVCENGKVNYVVINGPSGYVDCLSFELKEENLLQKVRNYLTEKIS